MIKHFFFLIIIMNVIFIILVIIGFMVRVHMDPYGEVDMIYIWQADAYLIIVLLLIKVVLIIIMGKMLP